MNKAIQLFSIFLLITALSGCVISIGDGVYDGDDHNWKSHQEKNVRYIKRLELGSSLAAIEAELGEPDFNDAFQRNGEAFRVLYYRTHRLREDGKTSKDETTPLVFIENKLVGWGDLAIEKATR